MASLQRLTDATESIYECLLRLQKSLAEDEPLYGDLQTVQVLTNEHRVRLSLSLSLSLHRCRHRLMPSSSRVGSEQNTMPSMSSVTPTAVLIYRSSQCHPLDL